MSGLGSRAVSGARWAVGARLLRTFIGIGTISVLTRFLSPEEFGIIALIGFVTGVVQVFGDLGTRSALVQRKTITPLQESSVFWSNIILSLAVVACVQVGAAPIAAVLGSPGMETPLRWMSAVFLVTALQGVPASVLDRRLAFNLTALTEVTAGVVGAATAIGMVLAGFKIEALVAQALVAALVSAAMIVGFSQWRPRLQFSMTELAPLLRYGSYVTGTGFVHFLSTRIDRPIVGNRLSAGDLGYLAIAETIVATPIRVTVQMVRRVMFPVMASIQDDDARTRRGYVATQHGLLLVMAPIALGLWALAEPIVAVVLGAGWEVVAALMGYMTLRSVLNSFNDFNQVIFAAKGWARFQFRWSIFSAVLTIGALLVSVQYGIVAIVAARLALTVILTPISSYFVLGLIKQPAGELLAVLVRPVLSAAAMAGAVVWLQLYLPNAPLVRIAAGIPLGVAVYVAMELLIDRRRALPLLSKVVRLRR